VIPFIRGWRVAVALTCLIATVVCLCVGQFAAGGSALLIGAILMPRRRKQTHSRWPER
jgi:hypothetical protein